MAVDNVKNGQRLKSRLRVLRPVVRLRGEMRGKVSESIGASTCSRDFSRWYLSVTAIFALQVLATPTFAQNAPQVLAPPAVEPIPVPIPVLEPRPFIWRELAFDGPNSIKIYEGDAVNQDGQPVRAWYAAIDYNDEAIKARAILSDAKIGREPVSALAQKNAALLAINGGYFDVKSTPSKTYSLVLSDGQILAANIVAATRPNGRFPPDARRVWRSRRPHLRHRMGRAFRQSSCRVSSSNAQQLRQARASATGQRWARVGRDGSDWWRANFAERRRNSHFQ